MTAEHGFIALARGIFDHPIVGPRKPYGDFEAWVWLLMEAAWKGRRVRVTNGHTADVITIERGQLTYSYNYMAQAWGWSTKRVRTFLHKLERDHQIELHTGHLQTVITVCNYDHYQTPSALQEPPSDIQRNPQGARKGHETEQDNNSTKDNHRSPPNESESFAEWYAAYPRKVDRHRAEEAYTAALVRADCTPASLLAAAKAYAADESGKDRKFTKHPATWLNAGSYLNDLQTSEVAVACPTRLPREIPAADWQDILRDYRRDGTWSSAFGPEPGQPGCLAPAALLVNQVEPVSTLAALIEEAAAIEHATTSITVYPLHNKRL
jgi:hypothetical protein